MHVPLSRAQDAHPPGMDGRRGHVPTCPMLCTADTAPASAALTPQQMLGSHPRCTSQGDTSHLAVKALHQQNTEEVMVPLNKAL